MIATNVIWVVTKKYTNAQGSENPTTPNTQSNKSTKYEPFYYLFKNEMNILLNVAHERKLWGIEELYV
ncbi:MAG: hypothetical protein F4Z01_02680 [Gammaproteobacteria bacterium]|nr:hypothetical protein [Gammaproteobacteria bacterium]MYF38076.1 hypothetical protein [Gammaproteobacteria bacterium]